MVKNEPVLFRIKNKPQSLFFTIIGLDDDGMKMRTLMGEPVWRSLLGETIIDSEGRHYLVKKLGMQSNIIWVEQIMENNLAS